MTDKTYRMLQSERGIGDLLMSMYGVYAFSVKHHFPRVQLFAYNHWEWLELFDIPNFEFFIINPREPICVDYILGDTWEQANQRWRENADTKEWYARKIGCSPLRPPIREAIFQKPVDIPKPYIIFSPFASLANRSWEIHNWHILAKKFREAGYYCLALDSPGQAERCKPIEIDSYCGQPIEWVARVCKNADLVISNDSGLAHLCSLLDTKTIVIMSMFIPHLYYSLSSNHTFILPENIPCVGCQIQADRGCEEKCSYGCWALQSISPNRVFDVAIKLLHT